MHLIVQCSAYNSADAAVLNRKRQSVDVSCHSILCDHLLIQWSGNDDIFAKDYKTSYLFWFPVFLRNVQVDFIDHQIFWTLLFFRFCFYLLEDFRDALTDIGWLAGWLDVLENFMFCVL